MRSCKANGLTLIEVIAGLALAGALLSVVMVSGSQHLRQLKMADHKRNSVSLLNAFLTNWSSSRFDLEGIAEAAVKAKLPVDGQFGSFGVESQGIGAQHPYRLTLARMRSTAFENGAVIRLTITTANAQRERIPTAWAEIVVSDE